MAQLIACVLGHGHRAFQRGLHESFRVPYQQIVGNAGAIEVREVCEDSRAAAGNLFGTLGEDQHPHRVTAAGTNERTPSTTREMSDSGNPGYSGSVRISCHARSHTGNGRRYAAYMSYCVDGM